MRAVHEVCGCPGPHGISSNKSSYIAADRMEVLFYTTDARDKLGFNNTAGSKVMFTED